MDPITITAFAFSLASYHFDREVKHNEINPGVFVELNNAYVVGAYRNSQYRTTVLVARQFGITKVGPVDVGVLAGYCSGYDWGVPVCAGLTLHYRGLTATLVPPVTPTAGVVGLSYRIPIK